MINNDDTVNIIIILTFLESTTAVGNVGEMA
jgi:hypothetical protein